MTRTTATAQLTALADALHDISWRLRLPASAAAGVVALPATEEEVLRRIGADPGCRVSALADTLGLQPSNVSTTVRGLVARGLVSREVDPGDRRAARLRLTNEAQRIRTRLEQARGSVVGVALQGLPDEQRAALLHATPALHELARTLGAEVSPRRSPDRPGAR